MKFQEHILWDVINTLETKVIYNYTNKGKGQGVWFGQFYQFYCSSRWFLMGSPNHTFTFQSKLSSIRLQLVQIFRIGIYCFWKTTQRIGFLVSFECETRTRIILIYFVKSKRKVLHKSKELLNISFYMCY
jgi:hypothetical protein